MPSVEAGQHAQKIREVLTSGFRVMRAERQTDRQTDKQTNRVTDTLITILRIPPSPGARGSYPALRVKVFFFADSGSLEGSLQFPGG